MGRPLRKEWTKDITVHCYEEDDGELITSKLEKQVGFNKYKNSDDVVIRLVDREEALENKEAGTGYVSVEDLVEGETKSLFKLTKHWAYTTDGASYEFNPDVEIDEEGNVTGIKLPEDSEISIEGLDGSDESSS